MIGIRPWIGVTLLGALLFTACQHQKAVSPASSSKTNTNAQVSNPAPAAQPPADIWQTAGTEATEQQLQSQRNLIAQYDTEIIKNPDISWYYAARGNAKRSLNMLTEAIRDYDKAISLDPEVAWYYAARGDAKKMNKQLDAAIQDYEKATQLDPNQQRFREALDRARTGK
jgi:tetratricopeptide (TPR) repeat protein